jgi:hypothetical protein
VSTNLEVVSDALSQLNVIAEGQTASPEQGVYCLRALNEMMEAWTEDGIDVGYFAQSSTTADCPLPPWALETVKAALSIKVAARYGATVSVELGEKYSDGMQRLTRKVVSESMKPANNDHLPQGTGSYGHGFTITNG